MQDICHCAHQDGMLLYLRVLAWSRSFVSGHSCQVGCPPRDHGLMQGKVVGTSLVIMDSFALPVQGTETRVNAANEANEYMVEYVNGNEKAGRLEHVIGWYHSHPGYGCWLSGIDVNTQMNNQKFQDPFVAVVIDPNRTISAGKVDIGAFRTYPENYTPPNATTSEYQSIPLSKIEDFGIFKSSLDNELLGMLWNKYWVNTLSQSPLISLSDFHQKLAKAQSSVHATRAAVPTLALKDKDGALANKIAIEAQHGLISQVLKDVIFSVRPRMHDIVPDTQVSNAVDASMSIG
ncbi:COP9 signalosome catalytic [Salix suchowensis]|nr:COP9 signalosome catalytic [Salix suchowensis]